MADCYPADHCLSSLLVDYQAAGGVCPWFGLANNGWEGVFNYTDQQCEYDVYGYVERGLCSARTLELLKNQEKCVLPIWSQKWSIFWTTREMIFALCGYQTYSNFYPEARPGRSTKEEKNTKQRFFRLFENLKETRKSENSDPLQQSEPEHLPYEDAELVRLIPVEHVYGENFF